MRKFDCPSCGWEGHPSFELNAKGKIVACCQGRDCTYQDHSLGPQDFNEGLATPRGETSGSMLNATVVSTAAAPSAAQPVKPGSRPAPQRLVGSEPPDVIGSIKARRDWLEAEIARLEGYRMEKRKLDKMLAAARRVEAQQDAVRLPVPASAAETN